MEAHTHALRFLKGTGIPDGQRFCLQLAPAGQEDLVCAIGGEKEGWLFLLL